MLSNLFFSGPLWQWSGKNFQNKRKGKGKKVFYKAIVRGDETISVSNSAFFATLLFLLFYSVLLQSLLFSYLQFFFSEGFILVSRGKLISPAKQN